MPVKGAPAAADGGGGSGGGTDTAAVMKLLAAARVEWLAEDNLRIRETLKNEIEKNEENEDYIFRGLKDTLLI